MMATLTPSASFLGAIGAAMATCWTTPRVQPAGVLPDVIMALAGGAGTLWGQVLGAAFLGLAGGIRLVKLRYLDMLALELTLIIAVPRLPGGLSGPGRRRS
jgi:ABC-type branched-subunit amino acid transport system permease subunit